MIPTGPVMTIGQMLHEASSTPVHALGERCCTKDGRGYRYVKNGSATLVVGNLLQSPAIAHATDCNDMVPANTAIGATSVTFTLGATAVAANLFAGGYLNVSTTPGNGELYRIKSHAAGTNGTAMSVTLDEDDAIRTALTAAGSRVDLVKNPYNGVIQAPTTLTGTIVGVAIQALTDGQYGWIQTWGPASVLNDGTGIIGSLIGGVPDNVGEAIPFTGVFPIVGHLMRVGEDGLNCPIYLTIS